MGGSESKPNVLDYSCQSTEYFPNEGPVHRAAESPDTLKAVWDPTLTDLAKVWNASVLKYGKRPCCGTRSQPTTEGGELGPYTFKTYAQINQRILDFASGLRHFGMNPGDRLGIYSRNNEDWVVSEQACYQQALVIVSIYDTLGPETCEYVINHGEISVLVAESAKFDAVLKVMPRCPGLRTVVVMGTVTETMQQKAAAAGSVKVVPFGEVELRGRSNRVPAQTLKPSDLCTIMYTSGTTGVPKGVMLSHANIVAVITGAAQRGLKFFAEDVHLSFLPLSHIFERVIMSALWSYGASLAFYGGNPRKLVDDMQLVHPTVLFGVPRVFNLIYGRVMGQVEKAGSIKRFLWNTAYNAKCNALLTGTTANRWDGLVFKKVREAIVGPRCRLVISGSAPLSEPVQQFLRIVFNCPVLQGYGLTETAAGLTLPPAHDIANCVVGPPLVCNEVKLEDVPEMNYTSRTRPQRGEVLVRGHNVFLGYYKNDEETQKVLQPDGWFHTGDIGEWTPEGSLKIIDRKKNIFKLSQGEYIAAEKIEMAFQESSFVQQIWIYGNSNENCIVAIVVPKPDYLVEWAASNLAMRGSATDMEFIGRLCANDQLKKAVLADLTRLGKQAKFTGLEFPKAVHLEPEPWTPENELCTPTFKLKRPSLLVKYKQVCDDMYAAIAAAAPPAPA